MNAIAEHRAPDISMFNVDGTRVTLKSYWSQRPIVLTFLRHFGCAFCREFIIKLRTSYADFVERGVEVVAVTQGDWPQTAHFGTIMRLPFPILADPTRESFQAFALLEASYVRLWHHSVIREGFALAGRGELPGVGYTIQAIAPTNNISLRQLGGTFVIDRQGYIQFAHVDNQVYDHPSIPDLLDIAGTLTEAS